MVDPVPFQPTAAYYDGLLDYTETYNANTLPVNADAVKARRRAIREGRLTVVMDDGSSDGGGGGDDCPGCGMAKPTIVVSDLPGGTSTDPDEWRPLWGRPSVNTFQHDFSYPSSNQRPGIAWSGQNAAGRTMKLRIDFAKAVGTSGKCD